MSIDVHLPGFCITRYRESNARERSFEMHPVCFDAERCVLVVPQKSDSEANDFVQRTQILKKLQHPAIPACIGDGTCEGLTYRILSWFPEEDLISRITQTGPLSLTATVTAIEGIAKALDHAHGVGVIHGALHPRCIHCGNPDEYWLTGFGNAPAADEIVGNVHHMAPEQFLPGTALRSQTDVYALAEVAYFMLTGQFAFLGGSADWLARKRAGLFPKAAELRSDVPAAVDLVLQCALAGRAENRFRKPGHFARALRVAVRTGRPAEPAHPTTEQLMTSEDLTGEEYVDRLMRVVIDPMLSDREFESCVADELGAILGGGFQLTEEEAAPLLVALPRFIKLLAWDAGCLGDRAVHALALLGESCLESLRAELEPDRVSLYYCLKALARCGCIAEVADVLARHEWCNHRRAAAFALADAPSAEDAIEALRPGLMDKEPDVRQAVVEVFIDRLYALPFDSQTREREFKLLRQKAKHDELIRAALQPRRRVDGGFY